MQEKNLQDGLTPRQEEVLALLRKGLTNQEICRALGISANTVKVHLAKIYKVLEVTNRTEAVSVQAGLGESRDSVQIHFGGLDKLNKYENAKCVYISLMQNMSLFELIQIQPEQEHERRHASDFQVNAAYFEGQKPILFIALYHRCSQEILWSASCPVSGSDDAQQQSASLSLQLWQQIKLASARLYQKDKTMEPRWWYAAAFHGIKSESRNKEAYQQAEKELGPLSGSKESHVYAAFVLACFHYKAYLDHWGDQKHYAERIQELAANVMRIEPESQYSMFVMTLASLISGATESAVFYLKKIIGINPLNALARQFLVQMYMITGQEALALEEISTYEKLIPESTEQLYILASKALLLSLLQKYDECIQLCTKILFIIPETPLPRLLIISALGWTGRREESQKHILLFRKYHPDFKLEDWGNLTKNINPEKLRRMQKGLDLADMKI